MGFLLPGIVIIFLALFSSSITSAQDQQKFGPLESLDAEERQVYISLLQDQFKPQKSPSGAVDIFGLASKTAKLIKQALPKNAKCTVDKLSDFIGLDAYGSSSDVATENLGIKRFNQSFFDQNPCYARRAAAFWKKLSDEGDRLSQSVEYRKLTELQTLGASSELPGYESGWLWRRALEAAAGNPVAAAHMVSLCTASADRISVELVGEEARLAQQKEMEILKRLSAKIRNIQKPENQMDAWGKMISDVDQKVKNLQQQIRNKQSYRTRLPCPNVLNLSQFSTALGVDISDDLKEKIAKANGRPRNGISAKYYHILTAAMSGCLVAQCGISLENTRRIATLLGKGYRMIAAQSESNSIRSLTKFLDKTFHVKDSESLITEMLNAKKTNITNDRSTDLEGMTAYGTFIMPVVFDQSLSPEEKKSQLRLILGRVDLQRLAEPKIEPPARISSNAPHGFCRLYNWDAIRCQSVLDAKKKIDLDFEWTASQHREGMQFGFEKCKSAPPSFDDQTFCEATKQPEKEMPGRK